MYAIRNEKGFYLESFDKVTLSWTTFPADARLWASRSGAYCAARRIMERKPCTLQVVQV